MFDKYDDLFNIVKLIFSKPKTERRIMQAQKGVEGSWKRASQLTFLKGCGSQWGGI